MRTRICIADDHELFRMGIANLINRQPDLEVVGQARDGFEIVTVAREMKPDLVLMDIQMPVCDGIEATSLLRAAMPDLIILMLTALEDDEKMIEALKAGANGYLLKDSTSAGFLRGIRGALEGEATLPRSLAARLVTEYTHLASMSPRPSAAVHVPTLTERELQVIRLIQANAANKEIAEQLSISLYTVKSHVRAILEKLNAQNRWHAVVIAQQMGIIRRD